MEVSPLKHIGAALILQPTSMGPEICTGLVAAGGPYTLRFERLLRYTFNAGAAGAPLSGVVAERTG